MTQQSSRHRNVERPAISQIAARAGPLRAAYITCVLGPLPSLGLRHSRAWGGGHSAAAKRAPVRERRVGLGSQASRLARGPSAAQLGSKQG